MVQESSDAADEMTNSNSILHKSLDKFARSIAATGSNLSLCPHLKVEIVSSHRLQIIVLTHVDSTTEAREDNPFATMFTMFISPYFAATQ